MKRIRITKHEYDGELMARIPRQARDTEFYGSRKLANEVRSNLRGSRDAKEGQIEDLGKIREGNAG